MDTVRFGIIGLGGMGRHHATYLSAGEIPGATLAAVADAFPAAREWAQGKFGEGVQVFETPDALFNSKAVDAVLIATPHYLHPPLAMQAFDNGIHALVEKPAGVYTKHVRQMNEAAEHSGLVFGIMFNQRTHVAHQKLRDLVHSGELGEIKRTHYVITDWFRSQAYYDSGGWRATWEGEGGGVLLNQSPHNLDLWQWICGMPQRVRAHCGFGKYHHIEVEDDVTAFVEYPNGATGVFITSTGEAPGTQSLEIAGDRGKVLWAEGKLSFWQTRVPVSEWTKTAKGGFEKPETWKIEIPVKSGEDHKGITKNFVNAILHGTPLLAKGQEGINGVTLANAMLLSAWTNDWVNLPFDDDLYYQYLQDKIKNSTFRKDSEGKSLEFAGTF
jgi:predicted dehydrogenase